MYPQTYKLKTEAYKTYKRRTIMAVFPIFLALVLIYACVLYTSDDPRPVDWTKVGTIVTLSIVFIMYRIVRLLQRQKKGYDDFVLVIDDGRITGKNLQQQNVDMSWLEVTQIVKHVNGSYMLQGGPQHIAISIPAEIENHEQLELTLNQIVPIVYTPDTFLTRHVKLLVLAVFALMLVFIYSRNKIVIGVTAPVLLAAFSWLFMALHRTPQQDPRSRNVKWGVLIPIAGVIVKAFFVLTGRY